MMILYKLDYSNAVKEFIYLMLKDTSLLVVLCTFDVGNQKAVPTCRLFPNVFNGYWVHTLNLIVYQILPKYSSVTRFGENSPLRQNVKRFKRFWGVS